MLSQGAFPGGNTLFWRLASFLVAAIVLLPVLMIFLEWFTIGRQGELDVWQHLLATKLDRLLLNTLILMLGVGTGVTVLGVSLAWLTSLCDFPGRRLFDWALMLPLAIPAYVMAFVFLGLTNYAGPLQTAFRRWFGPGLGFPDMQGALAVTVVLTLVLYPYVYLLARAAFLAQGRSMMDAGRILGLNARQAFLHVALPIARPATVAGTALALMETLADFGAVSVFNYDTFTTAIYSAWYGLFNLSVAAQLASLLLLFIALALIMEKKGRDQARFTQDERRRSHQRYRLQAWQAWGATGLCAGILLLAFGIPVGQLLLWVIKRGSAELDLRYLGFLGHTLGLAAVTAVVAVLIALLLGFVKRLPAGRLQARWLAGAIRIATLGYALPGSVLAVGLILSFTLLDQTLVATLQTGLGMMVRPLLVGSLLALIVAYCTRFLAVAFAPVESGLERIRPAIIEAAKSLGAGPGRLLREVYLPMLRPGLLTAAIIVFVDVMKEMPATLILRPFGWDTLAVRIYQMTAEGQWERAALPALTLVVLGLLPVVLLIKSARPVQ
ncbi:MAG: iron ABC transporter permease [Pseudomonadales bacterium]|nr:iron ABC transporter permease [Pseudomonadales bacterium]